MVTVWTWTRIGMLFVVASVVVSAAALAVADEPMFVRWLVIDDPGDQTIRDYWERAERNELEPPALVDLGTMLFYRGYPKDAVRYYRRALKLDKGLYEAWFRIGLVEHSEGNLDDARQAYERCLKKLTGHGWCNFYLGLLEEQLGHSSSAMYHYRRALKFAPELADPNVNPEVMNSDLLLGVQLFDRERRRFKSTLPLSYLEPKEVRAVRRRYEPTATPATTPTPEPEATAVATAAEETPPDRAPWAVQPKPTSTRPVRPPRPVMPRRAPQPTPPARGQSGGRGGLEKTPYGMPTIGNVSSNARFVPSRPRSLDLAEAISEPSLFFPL